MNSKWHAYTSFLKSGIRIIACVAGIIQQDLVILAGGLALAEVLGVVEELGDER